MELNNVDEILEASKGRYRPALESDEGLDARWVDKDGEALDWEPALSGDEDHEEGRGLFRPDLSLVQGLFRASLGRE